MQDSNIMTPTGYNVQAQQQVPTFNQQAAVPQKTNKRKLLTIIGGVSLAVCLIIAGVYLQLSNVVRDDNGRTVADLEKEICALEEEIKPLQDEQLKTFQSEGFSQAYLTKAETISQKIDQQIELTLTRDKLLEENKDPNPFVNGSAYFFIGAFLVLITSIIIAKVRG